MNITENDKAYLAGLFDGEGCISVTKYQGPANRTPNYIFRIIITQSGEKGRALLLELRDLYGVGSINCRSGELKRNQTMSWDWRVPTKEAVSVLEAILPYLRMKREEAEVGLEFAKRFDMKNHGGRGYTVPDDEVKIREAYYQRLHEMKGKSGLRGRKTIE